MHVLLLGWCTHVVDSFVCEPLIYLLCFRQHWCIHVHPCAQSLVDGCFYNVNHLLSCGRYAFTEINLGLGLNTLADEGSFPHSFLKKFELKFSADVSFWWCLLLVLVLMLMSFVPDWL